MTRRTALWAVAAMVVGGVVVAACDSGDRPLNYKKGVYLGKPHKPVDNDTLERLRDRAAYQPRVTATTSAGGAARNDGGTVGGPARPVSIQLRDRAQMQKGVTAGPVDQ